MLVAKLRKDASERYNGRWYCVRNSISVMLRAVRAGDVLDQHACSKCFPNVIKNDSFTSTKYHFIHFELAHAIQNHALLNDFSKGEKQIE